MFIYGTGRRRSEGDQTDWVSARSYHVNEQFAGICVIELYAPARQ